MSDFYYGGDVVEVTDPVTGEKRRGEINMTRCRINMGGPNRGLTDMRYILDGDDRHDDEGGVRHEDCVRLAFGAHWYRPHSSRSCERCGVTKAKHGSGAFLVSEAPGPPADKPKPAPVKVAPRFIEDLDGGVRSSFQGRPAYHYIRATDQLPRYDQLDEADGHTFENIVCKVRIFNPTGIGTWLLAAYDPADQVAWGIAELQEREVGSIDMKSLVLYRGLMGLPVERDTHWKPVTIAEALASDRM